MGKNVALWAPSSGLIFTSDGGHTQQISANRRLNSPTEVNKELVFRVQPKHATPGAILGKQFTALNANIREVPYNKVSEELKNGTINAQENTWSNSASGKYYEDQEVFHETNHGYLGYLLLTNKQFWNEQLSETERQALQKLLQNVTEEVNTKIVFDVNNDSREEISNKVTEAGKQVEVMREGQLERDKWCQQMQKAWKGNNDLSGGKMDKYIEIAKKANRAVNRTPSLTCFR